MQIDGPYDEAFYQKLLDLSTEDDGTVAFALTKVSRPFQKRTGCSLGSHTELGFPEKRFLVVEAEIGDFKEAWLRLSSYGLAWGGLVQVAPI